MSFPNEVGAEIKNGHSKQRADERTMLEIEQALAQDETILECLGAAVIMRWGTLPTKVQRELFERATSLADLRLADPLRAQIARLLRGHS
jgi:DNA-binding transcriptional ArsR family regulator